MDGTCRFGCRSLIAPSLVNDPHMPRKPQLRAASALPRYLAVAARSARAQRTVAVAAIVVALALLAVPAVAAEPWSMEARAFHAGFAAGVTTQPLAGGSLTPDPLAPDAGTVAYVVHTKGEAWAAVVVYDPATARYRQVCGLAAPFEDASDIQTFDPLLRSVLATVHERGFPPRVIDYTPDVRTMDLAQYEGAARPLAVTHRTEMPRPIATIPASSPAAERQPLTAQQTLLILAVVIGGIVLVALSGALLLHLLFRHREQMAVVQTATRPVHVPPRPTAVPTPRPVAPPPTPRPAAPPPPPPVATQQT